MLKVSAFYLKKQKCFITKKSIFLGCSQCQNKKALFTDQIFSEDWLRKQMNHLLKERAGVCYSIAMFMVTIYE